MQRNEAPVFIFQFVTLNSEVGLDLSLINTLNSKIKEMEGVDIE